MNSEKKSDKEKGQPDFEQEAEKDAVLTEDEDELTEEEEERAKEFLKELGYM